MRIQAVIDMIYPMCKVNCHAHDHESVLQECLMPERRNCIFEQPGTPRHVHPRSRVSNCHTLHHGTVAASEVCSTGLKYRLERTPSQLMHGSSYKATPMIVERQLKTHSNPGFVHAGYNWLFPYNRHKMQYHIHPGQTCSHNLETLLSIVGLLCLG